MFRNIDTHLLDIRFVTGPMEIRGEVLELNLSKLMLIKPIISQKNPWYDSGSRLNAIRHGRVGRGVNMVV